MYEKNIVSSLKTHLGLFMGFPIAQVNVKKNIVKLKLIKIDIYDQKKMMFPTLTDVSK